MSDAHAPELLIAIVNRTVRACEEIILKWDGVANERGQKAAVQALRRNWPDAFTKTSRAYDPNSLLDAPILDKPEDRLYHAENGTWWRREGLSLKAADPPPKIKELYAALAQAIRQGCTCDHLYGATCNIHRLETPAGIQEAVDHLKALEEAALFIKQFLLDLEGADCGDPLRDIRQRCHAPLHEKLDAALKGVPNV